MDASVTADESLGVAILKYLESKECFDSYQLSKALGRDHQQVVGAIKSLQSQGDLIKIEQRQFEKWVLLPEGVDVMNSGSYEARVYNAVNKETGTPQSQLMDSIAYAKLGFSKAMSLGWLMIDKGADDGPRVIRKVYELGDPVPTITDEVQECLTHLSVNGSGEIPEDQLKELKKRKLINNVVIKSFLVSKGSAFSTEIVKLEAELSPELIQSGLWKTMEFKAYNFESLGQPLARGHLHPLMKVRTEIRQIFLEMGFSEMPTNNFIESSFWNFDALFQPQQHPARDAHDTFFLKDPENSNEFPMDYLQKVKQMHESGGHGSLGYRYDWKMEETQKNILRTHTTAVTARMLYKLGQQEKFQPMKYFSIDRVFRNETLDATHLAEFHQIEGSVADYDLTLGDLMGMLNEFFSKMGIKRLRFKPAYNPYTEPSMEVFSYHEGLKKWVEVGNSGIFRPEMLLPMGLPPNVSVIAWGLSLERPTMIKYGISNIRELVGHKVNLEMVQKNPMCRLDI